MNEKAVRLNKYIRDLGVCSRRKAEDLIRAGRVEINGRVVCDLSFKVRPYKDVVRVDGRVLTLGQQKIYGILNKPFGVVSTLRDPEGRPCVGELLRPIGVRVFLVGRLDFDTMGLLPFTNDGEWAHRLLHPKYHIPRTYKVTVKGRITDDAIRILQSGVPLSDGPTQGSKVEVLGADQRKSVLRITIFEGRNRQVRRMFEALGYEVVHLIRIGFGPLHLGDLKVGEYRLIENPPFVRRPD